ncbi:MAG: diacylglycerol kinase family lipid kinase [Lachnospiraceae bacterium]|nr:diacylglycerol kinase family lipid kinase [Lachnospiraceae bacterium]
MGKKLYFIYNPNAGKHRLRDSLLPIIDIFVKAGYEVTIRPTQEKGDAEKTVLDLGDDYSLVVCAGGDGTLDEVVSGMLRRKKGIPIGFIPAGSTNDFAGSLCIPRNLLKAAKTAVNGFSFTCDVGCFNQRNFVYVAGFGVIADVSYATNQGLKNVLGYPAYIIQGLMSIPKIRPYRLRIEYDDTVIEDDFALGFISNSLSVGGFKNITGTEVVLDDGLFEVTLVKMPANVQNIHELAVTLFNGPKDTGFVRHFQTGKLKVISEKRISWTLDGEFGGKHREVILSNSQRAMQIVIPKDAALPGSAGISPSDLKWVTDYGKARNEGQ